MRRTRLIAALAVVSLAACADREPSAARLTDASLVQDETLFRTDSLAYTLRAGSIGYEGRIGVEFTNRTAATVYIVNCGGATSLSLEKLVDGAWRPVWSPVIPACLSAPITVPAGGVYRTVIHVFGGYAGSNTAPQFEGADIPGTYRAVWHSVLASYQDRLPFGQPLPLAQRVSNQFTLSVQPR